MEQSYDLLGRMISYTDGITEATYDYYTSNMRRSKTVDGEATLHVWIGDDIAADMGENSATYLQGVKLVWSDYGYYLYNAHGDVVQLIDEDCEVTEVYDYDAFGNPKQADEDDLNPYRYSGEYTDLESGYSYLRARYYDPEIGRFITADNHWNVGNMLYGDDPIKFGGVYVPAIAAMLQSGNLYVYCMNNPLLYLDQDGKIAITTTVLVGALVGGAISAGITAAFSYADDHYIDNTEAVRCRQQVPYLTLSAVQIVISGIAGIFSGGLAGTGAAVGSQIAGNAAISAMSNTASQVVDNHGFDNFSVGELLFDTACGAFAAKLGGNGAAIGNEKGIQQSWKQLGKRLAKGEWGKAWKYFSQTAHREGRDFVLKALGGSIGWSGGFQFGNNLSKVILDNLH